MHQILFVILLCVFAPWALVCTFLHIIISLASCVLCSMRALCSIEYVWKQMSAGIMFQQYFTLSNPNCKTYTIYIQSVSTAKIQFKYFQYYCCVLSYLFIICILKSYQYNLCALVSPFFYLSMYRTRLSILYRGRRGELCTNVFE